MSPKLLLKLFFFSIAFTITLNLLSTQAGTVIPIGGFCTTDPPDPTDCSTVCGVYFALNGVNCSEGMGNEICTPSGCECTCTNPDIACVEEGHCSDGVCCNPGDPCFSPWQCVECTSGANCGTGEICIFNTCVEGECVTNNECSGVTPICCNPGQGHVCGNDFTCVECLETPDCSGTDICLANVCVPAQCQDDDDCDYGFVCAIGQCIPPPGSDCNPADPGSCSASCPSNGGVCLPNATCSCYPDCSPGDHGACSGLSCDEGTAPMCNGSGECVCAWNPVACITETCDQSICGPLYTGICLDDPDSCLPVGGNPPVSVCFGTCMCVLGAPPEDDIGTPIPPPGAYSGPIVDLESFLNNTYRLFLPGAIGFLAVPLILAGAYKVMTSQGDPAKLKDGKEMITAAVIGTLFLLLSLSILRFILNNFLGG